MAETGIQPGQLPVWFAVNVGRGRTSSRARVTRACVRARGVTSMMAILAKTAK